MAFVKILNNAPSVLIVSNQTIRFHVGNQQHIAQSRSAPVTLTL